jgi:hypothetical protein
MGGTQLLLKELLPLDLENFLKYGNNFDAPNAHFDYSSLFSDAQVEKV